MDARKALVIDDDPDIRDIIRHFLESGGYEVKEAASGANAVEEAASYKPDVITLDILMPGMDGFQVFRRLRADAATRNIPVVVVSILADEGKFRDRITAFICKPFEKQELLEAVSATLKKAGRAKEEGVKKILIVDDEPDIVDIVRIYLESAGYQTCEAHDGIETIEKTRKELPDLIILDIKMPHMDGVDVMNILKKDEKYKDIPIIILTATRRRGKDKESFLKMGASGYIGKPFTEETLLAEVESVLLKREEMKKENGS